MTVGKSITDESTVIYDYREEPEEAPMEVKCLLIVIKSLNKNRESMEMNKRLNHSCSF